MGYPWAQLAHKQAQSGQEYVNPTYMGQAHWPWLTTVNAQLPPHSPDSNHKRMSIFYLKAAE
jgi:hypothetical protein